MMGAKDETFSVSPNGEVKVDYSRLLEREGERIGTEENFEDAVSNVFYNIGVFVGNGRNAPKVISNTIDYYKAIRFCYDKDTSFYDKKINNFLYMIISPDKCARV